jgi:hypothetical protein
VIPQDVKMAGLAVVALVVAVVLPLGVVGWVQHSLRGTGAAGGRARTRQLLETGTRARATVLRIEPTGTVVNALTVQCELRFQVQPLDGTPPFAGSRTLIVSRSSMPRAGDVWPAWFDPAAPARFVVGVPEDDADDLIPLYREFGIRHPSDTTAASA